MFIFLTKAVMTSVMIIIAGIGGGYIIDSLIVDEPDQNNQTMQSTSGSNQGVPTPTQKTSSVLGSTQRVVVSPSATSSPTDVDPVVKCNSKTGVKMVKKSVCSSYTDCPNGSGGYVFESQESCKRRWAQISSDLTKSVKDYTDALLEENRLQSEITRNQYEQMSQERLDRVNEETKQLIQEVDTVSQNFSNELHQNQQQLQQDLQNLIKITTPEPTPQPQGQGQMDYYMYQ